MTDRLGVSTLPIGADRHSRVRAFVLLAGIVLLVLWLIGLGSRHLALPDEGRYAEIAREMAASGDWITPRYNDLKYFEKPPLHLWATALAFQAFGVGEWQARLTVALGGLLGALVSALAAARWFGRRTGVLAALVLLSTPAWVLGSHFNSLDMSVSAALAVVLGSFLIAQHPATPAAARGRWMHLAWVAMGLAVLVKGLIGIVLPGLVLVAYTLASRQWSLWGRLRIISGALWFLAVAAPWFVLVTLRNPEFPQFFFIHEHWQRYTSGVHQRGAPAWYFVPQLLLGFLPWLGLAPRMAAAWRAEPSAGTALRPRLFLALWALAIFLFFSLSNSKLPGYILPVYPALAILAAEVLGRIDTGTWSRQLRVMLVVAGLALLASPLVRRLGTPDTPRPLYEAYALWIAGGAALAVAGLATAWWLNRRGELRGSIATTALALLGSVAVMLAGHETLGRSRSGVDLVPAIQAVLTSQKPDMPIYSVRLLDHTLPFYLRRTTIMVEQPDELAFGTQQEPARWVPTLDAFVAAWTTGPHALALMTHDTEALLRERGVPGVVVARDTRRVVLANFPHTPP